MATYVKSFELLCSSAKLERDKGVLELETKLKSADQNDYRTVENRLLKIFDTLCTTWETKHGALIGSKTLLEHPECSDDFSQKLQPNLMRCLEDNESRVRLAAGEAMGKLCKRYGPDIYVTSKDVILEGVKSNLERQPHFAGDEHERHEVEHLLTKLSSSPRQDSPQSSPKDAIEIFHDTAGWKSLETWMKCLQCVVDGCGPRFNKHIDQSLLNLIFQVLTHTNRFVRETGYYVCASLVNCSTKNSEDHDSQEDAIVFYGQQFAEHLAEGLADNWSQVRLASSVATRQFLLGLPKDEVETYQPLLVPRMCLNRYYVAEGVRIYSQETWQQVEGDQGKQIVEKNISHVVEFYESQTEADNHAVREAACACIAELGSKVDNDIVRPYVAQLLQCLLVCFQDDSWPVRDAACVACGNFVLCFPEESRSSMDALYVLFFENLQDNIPSVRQGSAVALGNVIRAYGKEASVKIIAKIKEGLSGVEQQPANSETYASFEKVPATYGVVKRVRDHHDDKSHTNQTMYSCGSLAPKMARGGGCMDHHFKRPSEPWELAEGCIHMISEVSRIKEYATEISQLLPLLSQASTHRHYIQHFNLLETLCKQLSRIAEGIGKRTFKMHIELFFDSIFYSLMSDNILTSTAAGQCLQSLSQLIGPNILKGRIEQHNPSYLTHWNSGQSTAGQSNQRPTGFRPPVY